MFDFTSVMRFLWFMNFAILLFMFSCLAFVIVIMWKSVFGLYLWFILPVKILTRCGFLSIWLLDTISMCSFPCDGTEPTKDLRLFLVGGNVKFINVFAPPTSLIFTSVSLIIELFNCVVTSSTSNVTLRNILVEFGKHWLTILVCILWPLRVVLGICLKICCYIDNLN